MQWYLIGVSELAFYGRGTQNHLHVFRLFKTRRWIRIHQRGTCLLLLGGEHVGEGLGGVFGGHEVLSDEGDVEACGFEGLEVGWSFDA